MTAAGGGGAGQLMYRREALNMTLCRYVSDCWVDLVSLGWFGVVGVVGLVVCVCLALFSLQFTEMIAGSCYHLSLSLSIPPQYLLVILYSFFLILCFFACLLCLVIVVLSLACSSRR